MPVNADNLKSYKYYVKPVTAGSVIVAGSLCANVTATGLLVPFVVGDVANYNRVFVAKTGLDNTLGGAGFVTNQQAVRCVEVYTNPTIMEVDFDAVAAADVETPCYGLTADSFQVAAVGPIVGRILKRYSATRAEILLA